MSSGRVTSGASGAGASGGRTWADPVPPVLGRPSPASSRPGALRASAETASAAYRADGGDGAGWSVRAASVVGVRHRLAGLGCEDAYAWRVLGNDRGGGGEPGGGPVGGAGGTLAADSEGLGVSGTPNSTQFAGGGPGEVGSGAAPATVILAVADGVGGVEGSAAASAAAVDAVCDTMTTGWAGRRGSLSGRGAGRHDGDVWRAAFAAAAAAVVAVGGATTLVVAVIDSDRRGTVGRVGDSAALMLTEGRWTDLWPAEPDDGPVVTATAALPGRSGAPAIQLAEVDLGAGAVLVLVTDGIANPLRDGPTTVAPALADALAEVPTPLGLAVVADFSRQGCFDDRTVVGLWPRTDAPPASVTA